MRFVRGHPVELAHDIRNPVADDHAPRTRFSGSRPEPGHHVTHVNRVRRPPVFCPTVHQHRHVGVHHVLGRVLQLVAGSRRSEAVRRQAVRPASRGVRQLTLHHRTT